MLAAVAGLDDDQLRQPLAPDAWSVHAILAHRLFWERQEVQALGQHLLGQRVDLLDFPSRRLNDTNAAAVRTMEWMTGADLLRDLQRTRRALLELLARVPDDDLNIPQNEARILLGIALTHDREHATQIRDWRVARSAQGDRP